MNGYCLYVNWCSGMKRLVLITTLLASEQHFCAKGYTINCVCLCVCVCVCVCVRVCVCVCVAPKTSIYTITSQGIGTLARDVCYMMSHTECYSPHYCLRSCCSPRCPELFQNITVKKLAWYRDCHAHSLAQKTQKSQPQCDDIQYIDITVLNSVQSSPLGSAQHAQSMCSVELK